VCAPTRAHLDGRSAIPSEPESTSKSTVHAVWDRRTTGEQVALYIRSLVFEGELRPGRRIPQDEIATTLGVSRIPVREAIIALEREGLVTIEPHRGAFINPITRDTIRDQYELYGLAFGLATRRAAERGGDSFVDDLDAVHTQLLAATDPDDFAARNDEFLGLIVKAASSPRVQAVLRVLSGLVPGNFFAAVPGTIETQRTGTTAMMRAVRKSGGDAAADACLVMMRRQGDAVIKMLDAREFFA
jgi:DNA-binding GntR family transcriptional regulator